MQAASEPAPRPLFRQIEDRVQTRLPTQARHFLLPAVQLLALAAMLPLNLVLHRYKKPRKTCGQLSSGPLCPFSPTSPHREALARHLRQQFVLQREPELA